MRERARAREREGGEETKREILRETHHASEKKKTRRERHEERDSKREARTRLTFGRSHSTYSRIGLNIQLLLNITRIRFGRSYTTYSPTAAAWGLGPSGRMERLEIYGRPVFR